MKTRLTLKPGQRGTQKLVEEYGEKLLYVRYRYDPERKRRVKTAEVIVDEVPWMPNVGRISRTTGIFHIRQKVVYTFIFSSIRKYSTGFAGFTGF